MPVIARRVSHALTALSLATLCGTLPMTGPASAAAPKPPLAEQRPHEFTLHGERIVDEYAWLKDRKDPRVRAYLEAENAYTDSLTRAQQPLREHLYTEMLARIQQTDLSV